MDCITFRTIQWGYKVYMALFFIHTYLGLLESSFSCRLGDWAEESIVLTTNLKGFERAKQAFQAVLHHEIHIVVASARNIPCNQRYGKLCGFLRIFNIVGHAYEFETEFYFLVYVTFILIAR
ncbi:MAG: hypothetical protein CM15mP58_15480 [Burkholderiaceae bacterium]|nr:MAG: hypothetical protein CM15mP58_15480 [Burkholderiaceae bacterium]